MRHCPVCARSFPPEERYCSIHGIPLIESDTRREQIGGHTGTVLDDRYLLAGIIGRGGMGVVYQAEHLRIGRRCAIKVLHGSRSADPKMQMRLFREVRATSRVRHPNVVEILDFGEHDEVGSYIVMEFLDGATLSRRIAADAPFPPQLAFSVMAQLCSALTATHSRGLIHRDLKPGNVMLLGNGRVKILDFGLVKPLDGATSEAIPTLTSDSVVMGTPVYMSPEHARGEVIDARADVYSLGVILYEMLVGIPPFDGMGSLEIIDQHLNAPVPLPSTLDPPVVLPTSVEWTLLKALHKQREGRYQSTAELADAIYQLADDLGFRLYDLLPARGTAGGREEPKRETIRWAGAVAPKQDELPPLVEFAKLALNRRDEIIDRVVSALVGAFPRYRTLNQHALWNRIARTVDAAIDTLETEPGERPTWEQDRELVEVPDDEATLTEVMTALWLAYTTWRPLLIESVNGDFDRFAQLAEQFDRRILPLFFHVVDAYVTIYNGKLLRNCSALQRQNEELQDLRVSLSHQVEENARQLAEAERLRTRIVDSVPSGIILLEQDTARVLLWNATMERMSGLSGSQVVGLPINHLAGQVEGLPFDEFAEQLRFHGEVGLRKLRIAFKGKEARTVYLKGHPFTDRQGKQLGALFVVDDVTEREQVVESLGRYLSKDVVDRILARSGPPEPEVRRRRAVVIAARLTHGDVVLETTPSEVSLQLVGDFVKAVSRIVYRRGGAIVRISADGLLAYFGRLGDNVSPAVDAALELGHQLEQIRLGRTGNEVSGFQWHLALHVGDITVINAGSEQLMVQTVVGETTHLTELLCQAAGASEILITADVLAAVDTAFSFVDGPPVATPMRDEPLRSYRITFDPAFDLETEPVTVRSAPSKSD